MKKAEILTCETDAKRKIADKSHRMVELAVNTEDAYALTEPKRCSAPARYEVVNFLATAGRTPAAEVSYYTGASARTLKAMEKAGLIAFSEEEELRVPSLDDVEPGPEIVLNEEQQRAFEEILGRVQAAKPSGHAGCTVLPAAVRRRFICAWCRKRWRWEKPLWCWCRRSC